MDFTTILNGKNSAVAATAEAQSNQQYFQSAHMNQQHSPRNAECGAAVNAVNTLPPHAGAPMNQGLAETFCYVRTQGSGPCNVGYVPGGHAGEPQMQQAPNPTGRTGVEAPPKTFHCSTCSHRFAGRSSLARHERTHTGVKPHTCDWPGCGKQFIQQSALTIHSRVHTGEKPHICERCGRPFSDSSSFARHRQIHFGKRPYKCPYADCQKTFTRRTNLTLHQNHHTGTPEEAAVETEAKLLQNKERRGPC